MWGITLSLIKLNANSSCSCLLENYNFCNCYNFDFLDEKISLCRICMAKCSRSGPDSLYMNTSRGGNVQRILGAIVPFWAKWGLGRVPRSRSFFSVVIQRTVRQLHNGRFSPNLVSKRNSVSRRGIWKDIFENFILGVICPQSLKSKIGQTGTSLWAGYRS